MTQKPCKDQSHTSEPDKPFDDPLAKARKDIDMLSIQLKREREYREVFANEAIGALLAKYHCRLQVVNGGIQIIAE